MNNFKKIGLSALAGSLVAFSVNAAEMTVSGGAAITFQGQDKSTKGNGWSMTDNLFFSGSAEMDNGFVVSTSFEIDESDNTSGEDFDARSMSVDMGEMGTFTFSGYDGVSALHSIDDMLPYAGGTAGWDMMTVATDSAQTREGRVTGTNGSNMMRYTNSTAVDGLTVAVSYLPSSAADAAQSVTSFNVQYSGIEGLTVGYGQDDNGAATSAATVDQTAYFATYAYGPVTVGYQYSEDDAATAADSDEFSGFGISYSVSDNLSVSYTETTYDMGNKASDEETTTIGASYTMGSMSLTATMNQVDNIAGSTDAVDDVEGYKLGLSFAF